MRPCTTALSGVLAGAGHSPRATCIWWRTCSARWFQAATDELGWKGKYPSRSLGGWRRWSLGSCPAGSARGSSARAGPNGPGKASSNTRAGANSHGTLARKTEMPKTGVVRSIGLVGIMSGILPSDSVLPTKKARRIDLDRKPGECSLADEIVLQPRCKTQGPGQRPGSDWFSALAAVLVERFVRQRSPGPRLRLAGEFLLPGSVHGRVHPGLLANERARAGPDAPR